MMQMEPGMTDEMMMPEDQMMEPAMDDPMMEMGH
jgi:hypothetical protein